MSRPIPGARPPTLPELVRAQDRMSFVYVERSVIDRADSAITARDERGTVHIPAASLGALILGPGTRVSHQAMVLLAESGSTAVWVGERGVRYYAHGRTLASGTALLQAQAELVSNSRTRLDVARQMYMMRFEGEDTKGLTMRQLRGKEGSRMRRVYKEMSQETGIEWSRRSYDPSNWEAGDAVNIALSAANTSLYGVVHAVVVALGCSPGLGFIHTGHQRSFVYDIADLYKTETTIPVAFEVAASETDDTSAAARRAMRDRIHGSKLLERCAADIRKLLTGEREVTTESGDDADIVMLWDPTATGEQVVGGVMHSEEEPFW